MKPRSYDFSKLTVMIVDDNLMMRTLVEQLLHSFGVGSVIRANNGEEALDILATGYVDLVITDWMMEPMDGFEFVRVVRTARDSPNRLVPILMMTGHSEMWRVAAARDAGINEFIVKPITGEALLSRMIYMIENPRSFVRTATYFGPDRRRKADFPYFGPERRGEDEDVAPTARPARGGGPVAPQRAPAGGNLSGASAPGKARVPA